MIVTRGEKKSMLWQWLGLPPGDFKRSRLVLLRVDYWERDIIPIVKGGDYMAI